MKVEEIWKDIEGYEGKYQVSNLGNARSLDRYVKHNTSKTKEIFRKGQNLKPLKNHKGYLSIDIGTGKGDRKTVFIHRMVAKAFIPNPKPNKYNQINHKNGIKSDNRAVNLEWCNNSINQLHAYKHGLNKRVDYAGKPKRPVMQIDPKTDEVINVFESIADAAKHINYKQKSNISQVCLGKRNLCGGYYWKYI